MTYQIKKPAIQSHTQVGPYYEANLAVDRNTATCTRTNPTDIGGGYSDKTVWWRVDLGGLYSIYSITILFRNYDGAGRYNSNMYPVLFFQHFQQLCTSRLAFLHCHSILRTC